MKIKITRRRVGYACLAAVIILITAFIFGNSMRDYAHSHQTSDAVTAIIVSENNLQNTEAVSRFVRKSAHLTEYASLGMAVMLKVKLIEAERQKKWYGTALFYVLAVAVFDEFIQSLSDRTSSTADILLDFFGALIGFAVMLLIWKLLRIRNKRRKNGK